MILIFCAFSCRSYLSIYISFLFISVIFSPLSFHVIQKHNILTGTESYEGTFSYLLKGLLGCFLAVTIKRRQKHYYLLIITSKQLAHSQFISHLSGGKFALHMKHFLCHFTECHLLCHFSIVYFYCFISSALSLPD